MIKCIYCKNFKPKNDFSNREHVIPQAFGTFSPNNLILNNGQKKYVCNACNNEFSKMERWLARDSFEGLILRAKYKRNYKSNSDKTKRLKIAIMEGEMKGILVQLDDQGRPKILPQVGLLDTKGNWKYIQKEEYEKSKKELINKKNYTSVKILNMTESAENEICRELGVVAKHIDKPIENNKTCLVEIKSLIDPVINRVLAKIAFNFFAYFHPKYIVCNKVFDDIRKYIEQETGQNFVKTSTERILNDETGNLRRACHIITINKNEKKQLIAQVTLYNITVKYVITLANSITDLIKNIKIPCGRIFNINTGKISPLEPSKIIILENEIIKPKYKIWLPY